MPTSYIMTQKNHSGINHQALGAPNFYKPQIPRGPHSSWPAPLSLAFPEINVAYL